MTDDARFLLGVSIVVFRGVEFTAHDFTYNLRASTLADPFGLGLVFRATQEAGRFSMNAEHVHALDALVRPLLGLGRPLEVRDDPGEGTGNVDIAISRFEYGPNVVEQRFFDSFELGLEGYDGADAPLVRALLEKVVSLSGTAVGANLL